MRKTKIRIKKLILELIGMLLLKYMICFEEIYSLFYFNIFNLIIILFILNFMFINI